MIDPDEQMGTASAVMSVLDIKSPTTLRTMIERDNFPAPYKLIAGKRHWSMSEVRAWLRHRMAQQRGERCGDCADER